MEYNKYELTKRAIARASSGLHFLNDCLFNKKGGTDPAYSRSWYILLSFNFEKQGQFLLKYKYLLPIRTNKDIYHIYLTYFLYFVNIKIQMDISPIEKPLQGGFVRLWPLYKID
ncbi:hypothetical protein IT400_00090 [Candidatus Nomurabacteria bacterium]|nr:hypothetical protein [Candidatus Nomurabacteria bacterium]